MDRELWLFFGKNSAKNALFHHHLAGEHPAVGKGDTHSVKTFAVAADRDVRIRGRCHQLAQCIVHLNVGDAFSFHMQDVVVRCWMQ